MNHFYFRHYKILLNLTVDRFIKRLSGSEKRFSDNFKIEKAVVSEIEKYSAVNLGREIKAIENSQSNLELPELTIHEKAMIYKYSEDGYETVNRVLRDSEGKKNTEFGKLLNIVLDKLPNFDELVYRSANLTKKELQRYSHSLIRNDILKEYSFISTSKSRLIAMAFNGNALFRIYSRSGKELKK